MLIFRDILQVGRLAAPLALGSLAQAVNELCDRFFLGNFSENALAAVVPGGMLSSVVGTLLAGTIGYSGAIIARRFGAEDDSGAAAALAQGCWLALAAAPLVLIAAPLGAALLKTVGHEPEICALETTYYRYALAASVLGILTTVLSGYFAARKRTPLVCLAQTAGCGTNIFLDWWLVPTLGITGAGLGLLAAGTVSCLILLAYAWRDPILRATGRSVWRFDSGLARTIIREGLPFGLSGVVGAGTFTLYSFCLGKFGVGLLAAANAVLAIHGIVYFAVCSLESSVLVLVGRAAGMRDTDGMRRLTRAGVILATGCVLAFYLTVLPAAERLYAWFAPNDADEFSKYAGVFLLSMILRDVFEGLQRVLTGSLRAIGRTQAILRAHVLCSLGVWLPLFSATTILGWPLATWQTMAASLAVHAAILIRLWYRSVETDVPPARGHASHCAFPSETGRDGRGTSSASK